MRSFGSLFLRAAKTASMSLALGAVACSSSGSGSTDAGSSMTPQQACAAQAQAGCTLRSGCSNTFAINHTFPDEMTCETRGAETCVSGQAAKGSSQTVAKIGDCATAYPTEACQDYFDNNPVAACAPATGTLQVGEPCGASGQCQSAFCATGADQACGTCQPPPAVGTPCQIIADCGHDLGCAIPAGQVAGTCAAFAMAGQACLTNVAPCAAGLSCVGDNTTAMTMGKCATAGSTVGSACDGSRKTEASCDGDKGLVCIPTAKGSAIGTCQNIQLVAPGAPCGNIGSAPITGYALCQAGGLCVIPTGASTGTCVAAAADGAACDNDVTKGPPCLSPAKCVPATATATAGTCTFPDATKCM